VMTTLSEQVSIKFENWVKAQHGRNISAFDFGGHQHHGGSPWAPRKTSAPWPLLFKTGSLKNSVSYMLSRLKVTFIADSEIALFHQYGTRFLPARPVLFLSNQDIDKAIGEIKKLDGIVVTAIGET